MSAGGWMPPESSAMPLSANEMLATMKREGYFEEMYKQCERTFDTLAHEASELRASLYAARSEAECANDRARRAGEDAAEWRRIAVKFATHVEVDWKKHNFTMHGHIAIAADVLHRGGKALIVEACRSLIDNMVAERKARGLHV
ncbi:MAG: hypothetical protein JWM41_2883 [Gemmatimonadetes bacterium]|nr:hypothetical protein [Gemmatimonadota bacterium]